MDAGMIILSILYLCGCISGNVIAIYGIVFGCVVFIASLAKAIRG